MTAMIVIRKASEEDREFVFNLRNETAVREASFDNVFIDWDTHCLWYKEKMSSGCTVFYIAEIDFLPAGQVRFDISGAQNAEVHIALSSHFRGMGYGAKVLRETSSQFFDAHPQIQCICAFVKKNNTASVKTFEKAGYGRFTEINRMGELCMHMILYRDMCTD
ncbi:MAG: hypothetical protein COW88_01825 [Candidatus Lloydbacteria bacterium CG22_combo_CG10-13_8_21_14_all_47_15]|uniref:N-acetyltransferase domain-containing protein n=1 Tax=Candidatus Lloydbacteria bacterium CG22_combo_CG10-13_8_21_14_all_47_15 TaxID=1974635 RepID=A0A2H0CUE8_9BACT|nr:MAG: hypothetical protein COW88_01825 [Candidatus Lloydbacteria bacterium CG22_combo_CG10-13_8_21_14_all_47_15]